MKDLIMGTMIAFTFAMVVYLPLALLLGGILDRLWDRYVLGLRPRKRRNRSAWFNAP